MAVRKTLFPLERVWDANLNRAAEGLRVAEDLARFVVEDERASRDLKKIRHSLHKHVAVVLKNGRLSDWREIMKGVEMPKLSIFRGLIASRDSAGDIGRGITTEEEGERRDLGDVLHANMKRAQEALRVIEEISKLDHPVSDGSRDFDKDAARDRQKASRAFKNLRYELYSIEKKLAEVLVDHDVQAAKQRALDFDLYVVTQAHLAPGRTHEDIAEAVGKGGGRIIQLRDKRAPMGRYFEHAKKIREITRRYGMTFIVNDYVDVCRYVDADGIHLGQEDVPIKVARAALGPDKVIGISTHNLKQAIRAQHDGADYISFGPIFETPSKKGWTPLGIGALKEAQRRIHIPIVAIGGIDETNLDDVLATGVTRAAVIRAAGASKNIVKAVKELRAKFGAR